MKKTQFIITLRSLIFFAAILCFVHPSMAQEASIDNDFSMLIGQLKSRGEKAALSAAAKLKNNIDPVDLAASKSYLSLLPFFDFTQTENEQFERLSIGAEGFFMLGKHHAFPYSAGIESTRNFESYAGIIELGWQPLPDQMGRDLESLKDIFLNYLFENKPFVAFQSGYKFAQSTNNVDVSELNRDDSKEEEDETIFRLRTSIGLDTDSIPFGLSWIGEENDNSTIHLRLAGEVNVWYDIFGDSFYDSQSCTLELNSPRLGKSNHWKWLFGGKSLDLTKQWGSGAPGFNTGEFWSVSLKMKL